MKMTNQWLNQLQNEINSNNIRVGVNSNLPLKIYNYTSQAQFSENWNEVTMTCRGLILDDKGNVVVLPPPKFFNRGEKFAAPVDLLNARISEKLDGMMIIIKMDNDYGLIITSRGSFDNKYIEAAKKFLTDEIILKLVPNYTYFCELLQNFPGDEAIILTQHPIPKLVCWAIMDDSFNEIIPDEECPFPIAQELSLVEAKQYLEQKVEGVVAQDLKTKERIKIKTEWFLEHHRLIANCTKKRVWEILSDGGKIEDLNIPDEFMDKVKTWEDELTFDFSLIITAVENETRKRFNWSDKYVALDNTLSPKMKTYIFTARKKGRKALDDLIWKDLKPKMV